MEPYAKWEEEVEFNWHGINVGATIYVETMPSGRQLIECQEVGPMMIDGRDIPDDLFLKLANDYDKELGQLAVEAYQRQVGP